LTIYGAGDTLSTGIVGEKAQMTERPRPNILQGTLDLLVLRAVSRSPMHGYAIAQTIHLLSNEVLTVEEGSLYPALYRLELDGAISSKWGVSENNRKAKYYEITRRGRRLLAKEERNWSQLSAAVDRVLVRG
jgi:PadR family transcriptional regulator, regulatory protein PadR